MTRKKKIFCVGVAIMLISLSFLAWWLTQPEEVTFYVQYPTAPLTVNVSLYVDGKLITRLTNYTFEIVPAIGGGESLTLSKGSHIISVFDEAFNVSAKNKFDVWSRLYVYVIISEADVKFHFSLTKELTY